MRLLLFALATLFIGCSPSISLKTLDLERPVDTSSRPIQYQEKKEYHFPELGIRIDNLFDGARLNGAKYIAGDTIAISIMPENKPINQSPWYSFRISSEQNRSITLAMSYDGSAHRYDPKISSDSQSWVALDSTAVNLSDDKKKAFFTVQVENSPLWISAQELMNSTAVSDWCDKLCIHPSAHSFTYGISAKGRKLHGIDIYTGDPSDGRDIILIFSRQHPPEVTGYLAMQPFVSSFLDDNILSKDFLEKYRILVFPLINPDGVDLGHWRHNTGGVDLNRDWAHYRQPEVRAVAEYIIKACRQSGSRVILGLDFHSTYHDVYYTLLESGGTSIPYFKDYWLYKIDQNMPNYRPNDRPAASRSPVSKSWFYHQFGAEGITYEIGDDTPRDLIILKGKQDALELMSLLILR